MILLFCVCYYIFHAIIRIVLRNLAVDVIVTLNKYNVDYWVDFGTLLGIIREQDIIFGDYDVDIVLVQSSLLEQQMKYVMKDLNAMGYKCKREEKWDAYRTYTTFRFPYTDMYINKKDDDMKVYLGSTGDTSNISYSLIGTPIYIKWNNIDVKVPENVHDVLIFRYGEDYMTPKMWFKGRNP